MGRAARNHGGTGGHGCVPLPGERPNFNRHVLTDKNLLRLVSNNDRKKLVEQRDKKIHLEQQKGFDAEWPKVEELKHQVTSAEQPVTSAKQAVTSTKQPVTSAKQPVTSIKQPVTSVEQEMAYVEQSVSSAKE